MFGNDYAHKYFVLGWLSDSTQKHESYQLEPNLIDFVQPVHVLHEREDEKEGESAVKCDSILGCYSVSILKYYRRFENS